MSDFWTWWICELPARCGSLPLVLIYCAKFGTISLLSQRQSSSHHYVGWNAIIHDGHWNRLEPYIKRRYSYFKIGCAPLTRRFHTWSLSLYHVWVTRIKFRRNRSILDKVVQKERYTLTLGATLPQYVVSITTLNYAYVTQRRLLDRSDLHVLPTHEVSVILHRRPLLLNWKNGVLSKNAAYIAFGLDWSNSWSAYQVINGRSGVNTIDIDPPLLAPSPTKGHNL